MGTDERSPAPAASTGGENPRVEGTDVAAMGVTTHNPSATLAAADHPDVSYN